MGNKNFNVVPKKTLEELEKIEGKYLKVGISMEIELEKVKNDEYSHLKISYINDRIEYSTNFLPDKRMGRYSKYNIEGRTIRRKDLPKVPYSYSIERVNFGDSRKGYHTIHKNGKAHQKEEWFPEYNEITTKLLETKGNKYYFNFEYDIILDKESKKIKEELLFAINILQENCGGYSVYENNVSDEKLKEYIYVNWEILPPGKTEFIKLFTSKNSKNQKDILEIEDRYNFIESLNPKEKYKGTNKLSEYFVAVLDNGKAILENINYGNAIFIIHEDWEKLSKLNKQKLTKLGLNKVTRVAHNKDWKNIVLANIK